MEQGPPESSFTESFAFPEGLDTELEVWRFQKPAGSSPAPLAVGRTVVTVVLVSGNKEEGSARVRQPQGELELGKQPRVLRGRNSRIIFLLSALEICPATFLPFFRVISEKLLYIKVY